MDGLFCGCWVLTEPQDGCKMIPALKEPPLFSLRPETSPKSSYTVRRKHRPMKHRWQHRALRDGQAGKTVPRESEAGHVDVGLSLVWEVQSGQVDRKVEGVSGEERVRGKSRGRTKKSWWRNHEETDLAEAGDFEGLAAKCLRLDFGGLEACCPFPLRLAEVRMYPSRGDAETQSTGWGCSVPAKQEVTGRGAEPGGSRARKKAIKQEKRGQLWEKVPTNWWWIQTSKIKSPPFARSFLTFPL